MKLVVGSKSESSWSLRPWLLMKQKQIPFDEQYIPNDPGWQDRVRAASPSAKVPVLVDNDVVIQESLAICEYIGELVDGVWPADRGERAIARAIACEMHAGFEAMRKELPMRLVERRPRPALSVEALRDVARVQEILRERLDDSGGPFLFQTFGAVDAMYAPVCTRFVTYDIELDDVVRRYVDAIYALPAMQEWTRAAEAEVARGAR